MAVANKYDGGGRKSPAGGGRSAHSPGVLELTYSAKTGYSAYSTHRKCCSGTLEVVPVTHNKAPLGDEWGFVHGDVRRGSGRAALAVSI